MNETDKKKLYEEDIDRIADGIRCYFDASCSGLEFTTDQKIKALEIVLKDFQDFPAFYFHPYNLLSEVNHQVSLILFPATYNR